MRLVKLILLTADDSREAESAISNLTKELSRVVGEGSLWQDSIRLGPTELDVESA